MLWPILIWFCLTNQAVVSVPCRDLEKFFALKRVTESIQCQLNIFLNKLTFSWWSNLERSSYSAMLDIAEINSGNSIDAYHPTPIRKLIKLSQFSESAGIPCNSEVGISSLNSGIGGNQSKFLQCSTLRNRMYSLSLITLSICFT